MRNSDAVEIHRKLVRDNIPDVILANGDHPQWHRIVDDSAYLAALHAKVVEEARELQDAGPADRIHELADLFEVVTALMVELGISEAELQDAAGRKREVKGGFTERVWLERVVLGQATDT